MTTDGQNGPRYTMARGITEPATRTPRLPTPTAAGPTAPARHGDPMMPHYFLRPSTNTLRRSARPGVGERRIRTLETDMDTQNANAEIFAAMADAQAEIENAAKNAANSHFRSRYADLGEVMATIRATLPKHGLSLMQHPRFDGALASVDTILGHKAGGYITATASCVPAKSDAQGIGAATTYLRRYSAAAICGIHQEDDDGERAAHSTPPISQAELADWTAAIEAAATLESLAAVWRDIPAPMRRALDAAKNARKAALS